MKKLNIKAMAKDMSFDDRAKLIFAHCVRKGETLGVEGVLERDEEDALVDACRRDGQINMLNKLVALYNLSIFCMADIALSKVKFELVVSRIETFLFALSRRNHKNPKKDGIFIDLPDGGFIPNESLQVAFVRAFGVARYIQQACFSIEYVFELAGMTLVGEEDLLLISESKKLLKAFYDLEGLIGVMRLFRDMIESGIVKRGAYNEKEVYDFLSGKFEVLELDADAKKAIRDKINDLMIREGHPIT